MTRWHFTGFDDGAAEYVDETTGEAYYHRPSLKPRVCFCCRIEYVSHGRIYCDECTALRALLRGRKDQET
jgi:hypothetical protein